MTADTPDLTSVLLTADSGLRDEVRHLAAACGVGLRDARDVPDVRRAWRHAPAVMVGVDQLADVAAADLPRRDRVVVVGFGPDDGTWWRRAVQVRADSVLTLPEERDRLVQVLAELADGATVDCRTVAFVGAGGGAGASTLAASVGLAAAERRDLVMLVDLDPASAGADVLLGAERHDGLRWHDLASSHGRLGASALRSALPVVDDLRVLAYGTGSRTPASAPLVQAVLDAGMRSCDLVVVDAPRVVDDGVAEALATVDCVVVVTRPDVCSATAAARLSETCRRWCRDVRLVVRTPGRSSAAGEMVAEQLGVPLLGTVPHRRRVGASVDDGLGPLRGTGLARPVARLTDRLPHEVAA